MGRSARVRIAAGLVTVAMVPGWGVAMAGHAADIQTARSAAEGCTPSTSVRITRTRPVIRTSAPEVRQSTGTRDGRRWVTVTRSVKARATVHATVRTRVDECAGMDPEQIVGMLSAPVTRERTTTVKVNLGRVSAVVTRSGDNARARALRAAQRSLDDQVRRSTSSHLRTASKALKAKARKRALAVSFKAMAWPQLSGYPSTDRIAAALMARINSTRAGLDLVEVTDLETLAAQADHTARRNIVDLLYRDRGLVHTDLGLLIDEIEDTCPSWGGIGENLAMVWVDPAEPSAQAIAAAVMGSWRNSDPHWKLLTAASNRRAAVGIAMRVGERGMVAVTATLQVVQARCASTP